MIVPDYIERSNRKTLSLTVLKDGNIIVKAPISMKDDVIERFVFDKQDWIKSKLMTIKETKSKFDDVMHYQKFLLYGNKYTLLLDDVKKIETHANFQIIFPKKTEQDKVLKGMKSWYKKVAKKVLADRLAYVESRLKLKSKAMRITDSKGKWGSCNSFGTIVFNWRVVMLPPDLIDYVIVHELCHLVEMNHSKKFWTIVERFLPKSPVLKKNIKEYGFLLGLFRDV